MKVEVLQNKLSKALVHINKAISNRPNIPALANVLIETGGSQLILSSTDLEIGITIKLGANIAENGKLTVSAKLLSEFVNTLKPSKLILLSDGSTLVVNSVDNSAEFYTIPVDEFPEVPKTEDKALFSLNAYKFARMLRKTTFSAGTDSSRPVLTGILLKATKRNLTLFSADGYRLSKKNESIENGPDEDFKEIIPAKTLMEIEKMVSDMASQDSNIEIHNMVDKNQIIFKLEDAEIATRLIEGEFPDFDNIIPKDKNYFFSAKKQEFIDCVKLVHIFARNSIANKCLFSVDTKEQKLTLSAIASDLGNNKSSIEVFGMDGDNFEASYNAKFLQDMLNSIEGEDVLYETMSSTSPGVFKDSADEEYVHIIMPMRME